VPEDGLVVAPARDGTTNALGLSRPGLFAALYGPGSAEEFRSHASQLGVPSTVVVRPGLQDDVDTPADLERVADRVGPHTRAVLAGATA
jgi:2-phospho-L-lactate guanylyltransferase (CobY/MobA/RfbA family)